MVATGDACLRCGASLSLMERLSLEDAVEVPGMGSLCPNCYRNSRPKNTPATLNPEGSGYFFLQQAETPGVGRLRI